MSKSYFIEVTRTVEITIEDHNEDGTLNMNLAKATAHSDLTREEHAEHLAKLQVLHGIDSDFHVEGYGKLERLGISVGASALKAKHIRTIDNSNRVAYLKQA